MDKNLIDTEIIMSHFQYIFIFQKMLDFFLILLVGKMGLHLLKSS